VPERPFAIRPARDEDRVPLASLFAAVAEERDGDRGGAAGRRRRRRDLDRRPFFGFGELAMLVARGRHGRGVGSALVEAAIDWGRGSGLHKLSLAVFPHNRAAIAPYRKHGFEVEGRRRKDIRRASGELWGLIEMGFLLGDE
jgi:RimJ/RimL family protein N-acetyltransferase